MGTMLEITNAIDFGTAVCAGYVHRLQYDPESIRSVVDAGVSSM
jgi:hypothetical protein